MLDDVVGGGRIRSNSAGFEVFSPKNKSDMMEMGEEIISGISVAVGNVVSTTGSSGSGAARIDNTTAKEKITKVH